MATALTPADFAMFGRICVSPELIERAGIERIDDKIARSRGISLAIHPHADMGGLWFPYHRPGEPHRITARVRRDRPEQETAKIGEVKLKAKYVSPFGDSRCLYYPPDARELLGDATVPVVFVEAEKSTLSMTAWAGRQHRRLLILGTAGCWGWRGKIGIELNANGERETIKGPLADFDLIAWDDREAIIAFDSNATTNPEVRTARKALAKELQKRGVRVRIADVPALPGVNGPDDLIAEQGDDALLGVLDAAKPFTVDREKAISSAPALSESGIDALQPGADPEAIEEALRVLGGLLIGADPLTRELTREGAIRKLAAAGIKAPARLIDAAIGPAQGYPEPRAARIVDDDPAPWEQKVDGPELLSAIEELCSRFVVLPAGAGVVLALWVPHTHAFDAARATPYLAVESPEKRCGKTLLLEVIGQMVRRPLTTSNISLAMVFRVIECAAPTLLIDETETFLENHDGLRGVLNGGHRRAGAYVIRGVGDDYEPKRFSTWCPKALALIGKLPDTLQDRSIVIEMRRKTAGEKVDPFRPELLEIEFEQLRRKLVRWAQDTVPALERAEPELPKELGDRAADCWRPLLAIADAAGGNWPRIAREVAVRFSGSGAQEDESANVMLLADLRDLFASRGERVTSAEIVAALAMMESRPWPEWRHGKPMTVRQLAHLLKGFGISPRQLWVDNEKVRGYELADFEDAFKRYLPAANPAIYPVGAVGANEDGPASHFFDPVGGPIPTRSKTFASDCEQSVLPLLPDENPHEACMEACEAIAPTDEQGFLPDFAAAEAQPQAPARTREEV